MIRNDFAVDEGGLAVRSARWSGMPNLAHGITTRAGLPDPGKGDFFVSIAKARVAGALPELATFGADQIHSDAVALIREPLAGLISSEGFRWNESLRAGEFPRTDALVTALPGTLLVIQTADCLPVFAIDPQRRIAGLAHCGWRGLRANLTARLIESMAAAGAWIEYIQVWLGPCIHADRYEVSRELVEDFRAAWPGAPVADDGRHLDLPAIANHQLVQAGIDAGAIADSGQCTFACAGRYHSWRAHGPGAGRMLSFLGFRQ